MIDVAVLGYGWWGEVLTSEIGLMDDLRVAIVADTQPSAIRRVRDAGIDVTDDPDAAIADPRVDAVIVCTPNGRHPADVEAAASAGKHVFCEKPVALTAADAIAMVSVCKKYGVVLGTGYERRFEPPIIDLLARARAGDLGRIEHVEGTLSQDRFFTEGLSEDNWRLSPRDAPAGPLTATGVHLLDLTAALLGHPLSVDADLQTLASDFPNGDTLSALIRCTGGANAVITAMLATTPASRFAVYGARGWMEVTADSHLEGGDARWFLTTALRGEPRQVVSYPAAGSVRANLAAFAAAVRGERPYPITGTEIIAGAAMTEAIVASATSGLRAVAPADSVADGGSELPRTRSS